MVGGRRVWLMMVMMVAQVVVLEVVIEVSAQTREIQIET